MVAFVELNPGKFIMTVDRYELVKVGWFGARERRRVERTDYVHLPDSDYWIRKDRVVPLGSEENLRLWEMAMAWLADREISSYITRAESARKRRRWQWFARAKKWKRVNVGGDR